MQREKPRCRLEDRALSRPWPDHYGKLPMRQWDCPWGLAGGDGKKTPTSGRGRGRCRGPRLGHCGGSCGLWTTRRGLRSLPVHAQRGMLTVRGARAVMLWGFNSDEVIGRIEQL